MSEHRNRLKTTVSAVASAGLGDFTVSTASSGYRTFVSGDNALTFDCLITEGTTWEVRTGCTYTHSGTTLSRGTLEDSSTGSAITFTTAAIVSQIPTAAWGNGLEKQLSRGAVVVRNDGSTTLSLAASTFTKLTCINTEEYDPNGWWDNSNQKFQPTRSGKYLIILGAQVSFVSPTNPSSLLAVIRKNGGDFAHAARGWVPGFATTMNAGVSGACVVHLNGSTDYIEPFGWQNDTVSRSTVAGAERQFFMAVYLSES